MTLANTFPKPRAMCVVCEHIEVPLRTQVCATCRETFALVDGQEPQKRADAEPARLIAIGPTDV